MISIRRCWGRRGFQTAYRSWYFGEVRGLWDLRTTPWFLYTLSLSLLMAPGLGEHCSSIQTAHWRLKQKLQCRLIMLPWNSHNFLGACQCKSFLGIMFLLDQIPNQVNCEDVPVMRLEPSITTEHFIIKTFVRSIQLTMATKPKYLDYTIQGSSYFTAWLQHFWRLCASKIWYHTKGVQNTFFLFSAFHFTYRYTAM